MYSLRHYLSYCSRVTTGTGLGCLDTYIMECTVLFETSTEVSIPGK